MVITSVNAGLGDRFRKKMNDLHITIPTVALSSEPSSSEPSSLDPSATSSS
ncbi:hypothetical protein BASA84_000860, partial [Batrachochytrium salamandrivorans]